MPRFHTILCILSLVGGTVNSFNSPSTISNYAHKTYDVHKHGCNNILQSTYQYYSIRNTISLSLSNTDDNDIDTTVDLDTDLNKEIEDALSLAQDALLQEMEEMDEDDTSEEYINNIADMLLEAPPTQPSTIPVTIPMPPKEEPSEAIITARLEETAVVEEDDEPPQPPKENDISLAESLQKKAAEEMEVLQQKAAEELEKQMEKLKVSIFGVKDELAETEASIKKEDETAALLQKEIENSIKEREDMIKRIEEEFASEKKSLLAQMEIASAELKVAMDESAQNITNAKKKATEGENALISLVDSLKTSIDEVSAKTIEINIDKEKIERSKQTMLDKVIQEGKNKVARFKKSMEVDISYAKEINADLARRVEEVENLVRGAYDQINQIRTDRVSLQQQIADVEKNALAEISSLQAGIAQDDERYANTLQQEKERLDGVIETAYQAYAIRICKKITNRRAVEDEYKDQLREVNKKVSAAKAKQKARVTEYLDKLEAKHKKERIAIYQEKVEALSVIRKQMKAELAIENEKIDKIHTTMQSKIDEVQEETSAVKAEFEKEMAEKRKIAQEEEAELLNKIEDVRVDMTDKLKTQRRLYQEKKDEYLDEIQPQISKSEAELHQSWRELAGIKKSVKDVSAKRDDMIADVSKTQSLIDSYESDRTSFRKSISLTAKVAKDKIRTKTKRLLKRNRSDKE